MRCLDSVLTLYIEIYDLLYKKEEHIFSRDTRHQWEGNIKNLKEDNKIFWSCDNGWVLGSSALVIDDMPKEYRHRDFNLRLFKEMALKIKELQHKDGLWRTSFLSPASFNHAKVSGSGFYTFTLAWGINDGLLDKTAYTPAVTKTWKSLMIFQQDRGMVGGYTILVPTTYLPL
ncbi:glycoside hydrolase family 88 protein [Maribacter antarcticus]|uniref:glycoside hydrolase family 88 protein n=1 Tax=Maribacter antarcticus TaxID=505250 RepID=UPI00047C5966|nr:glycoside hydrolase family 88 protein [Maribacter antarcticus]